MEGLDYPLIYFAIAQGTFPWQTILWPNRQIWATPPSFDTVTFRNRLQDQNSDVVNDFSTLFTTLWRFGPVAPEFTTLECV